MNYIGSGGKGLYGCAIVTFSFNYITKYQAGDTLWLRSQALKGEYEKVVLKKVYLTFYNTNSYYNRVAYFDTFNAFHDERELLTYNEAKNLVNAYIARRNAAYLEMIKNC